MKRLFYSLIVLSFFCYGSVFSQQWLWVEPGGGSSWDYAHACATDADGNVFATGSYQGTGNFGTTQLSNSGQTDVFIVKYNNSGSVLWAKRAAGSSTEEGQGIAVDTDGDCYITGYFTGTITFATGTSFTSANGKDIFIAKYNGSNGNLIWAKSVSVSGDAEGAGIVVDADYNTYITGYFRNTATFKSGPGSIQLSATGGLDAYVAKYNSSGTCQWAQKGGGNSLDRSYGIALGNNELVVTGYYEGSAYFSGTQVTAVGNGDAFIAKYETDGTFLWVKSFGGANTDYGHAVSLDTSGNTYISGRFEVQAVFAGQTLSSYGSYDIFLSKLNNNGNLLWVKNFGGLNLDYTKSMQMNKYGDALYLTGAYSVSCIFDTDTLVNPSNSQDVFVCKTDTSGNVLWVTGGGSQYDDQGNGIAIDTFGVVFVAGSFYNSSAVFGSLNVNGYAEYDAFVGKICPLSAQVQKSDVSCHGLNDGSVIIVPDGGTPPFTYTWVPNISNNDSVYNLGAGTYTIDISDANSCMASVQVTIIEPLPLNLSTSIQQISCHDANDASASVSISGGTGPFAYEWNTLPVQTNDTAFNLSEGTYKVVVTDGGGCKDSLEVIIQNPTLLQAFAGAPQSVCAGNMLTLGAQPAATGGVPPYNYTWSPALSLDNPTVSNPVATPNTSVTYTLDLLDSNGCSAQSSVAIGITQPPQVMISQNDTFCLGGSTNLAANASGALSYLWAPAASLNNPNIQTPVASPTVTTAYIVTVSFTGNCYNTAGVAIVVNQPPQITTGGNQSVCNGDSLQLSVTANGSFVWQPAGLLYNNTVSNPQTHPLTQNASFVVTVTDNNGCSNTEQIDVTVNPVPTPIITENNGILTSNYAVGNQWYLNGNIISGATDPTYTPTQDGDYTVVVTLFNCSGTSSVITMVNVGIEAFSQGKDFYLYPNPTGDFLHIEWLKDISQEAILTLTDLPGRVLNTQSLPNTKSNTLDLRTLNPGIYLLHVSAGLQVYTVKVVKY